MVQHISPYPCFSPWYSLCCCQLKRFALPKMQQGQIFVTVTLGFMPQEKTTQGRGLVVFFHNMISCFILAC